MSGDDREPRGREEDHEDTEPERHTDPPSDKPLDLDHDVDWRAMHQKLLGQVRRKGMEIGYTPAFRVRDGMSVDDLVQEAIAEFHAHKAEGKVNPTSLGELEALLFTYVQRQCHAWRKRARERQENLLLHAPTLSVREMFDMICMRDEQAKFFAELFNSLDPETQTLLNALLTRQIPFKKNEELAQHLATTAVHIANMKRRLVRQAQPIMAQLINPKRTGGST